MKMVTELERVMRVLAQKRSSELVVLSFDFDVEQSLMICTVSPGLLQELDVFVVELATNSLLELSSASLLVCLFLLGGLVDGLKACLHTQSDGTSRAGLVVGIGSYLDGIVLGGREELVTCGA